MLNIMGACKKKNDMGGGGGLRHLLHLLGSKSQLIIGQKSRKNAQESEKMLNTGAFWELENTLENLTLQKLVTTP